MTQRVGISLQAARAVSGGLTQAWVATQEYESSEDCRGGAWKLGVFWGLDEGSNLSNPTRSTRVRACYKSYIIPHQTS